MGGRSHSATTFGSALEFLQTGFFLANSGARMCLSRMFYPVLGFFAWLSRGTQHVPIGHVPLNIALWVLGYMIALLFLPIGVYVLFQVMSGNTEPLLTDPGQSPMSYVEACIWLGIGFVALVPAVFMSISSYHRHTIFRAFGENETAPLQPTSVRPPNAPDFVCRASGMFDAEALEPRYLYHVPVETGTTEGTGYLVFYLYTDERPSFFGLSRGNEHLTNLMRFATLSPASVLSLSYGTQYLGFRTAPALRFTYRYIVDEGSGKTRDHTLTAAFGSEYDRANFTAWLQEVKMLA